MDEREEKTTAEILGAIRAVGREIIGLQFVAVAQ
jgi:hypothetical protein